LKLLDSPIVMHVMHDLGWLSLQQLAVVPLHERLARLLRGVAEFRLGEVGRVRTHARNDLILGAMRERVRDAKKAAAEAAAAEADAEAARFQDLHDFCAKVVAHADAAGITIDAMGFNYMPAGAGHDLHTDEASPERGRFCIRLGRGGDK
jgi:ribosomal 50S subunit-associated protein YjgA (DUF615 family)